jgi:hypothetical protein
LAPAVVDIRGTTIAVIGATDFPGRTAATWAAGPSGAGVASARDPERLLRSVREASGVLTLTVHDGAVVADSWTPTFTEQDGLPRVLTGSDGDRAVASWRALCDCTGLTGSLEAAEAMS